MTYSTYRDIERCIESRAPFKGNSCHAEYESDNGYTIYSYSTVIYSDKDGLNEKKYSMTTSRLQNIIRRCVTLDPATNKYVIFQW